MPSTATTLSIELGATRYPIHVGTGLLSESARLSAALPEGPWLLVSDTTVAPLYAPRLRAALPGRALAECLLPMIGLATSSTVNSCSRPVCGRTL